MIHQTLYSGFGLLSFIAQPCYIHDFMKYLTWDTISTFWRFAILLRHTFYTLSHTPDSNVLLTHYACWCIASQLFHLIINPARYIRGQIECDQIKVDKLLLERLLVGTLVYFNPYWRLLYQTLTSGLTASRLGLLGYVYASNRLNI